MALCVELAQTANPNAISDAATGAALAQAALTGAGLNVRTNTHGLSGYQAEIKEILAVLEKSEKQAAKLDTDLKNALKTRAGF
jgi:formiminotetrahydrofolate cyclodeaminase